MSDRAFRAGRNDTAALAILTVCVAAVAAVERLLDNVAPYDDTRR